jgi:hypothetical protein
VEEKRGKVRKRTDVPLHPPLINDQNESAHITNNVNNTLADNPNTTLTLEYTKDKYNAKIIKQKVSPKVPPTTYVG